MVDNLGSFTPSWSLLHSWVLSKRAKHDNSSLLTTFLGVSFGVNGWIKWRTHASASVAVLQHLLNFSPRWVALNQIASLGYLDKLTWTKRAVRCAKDRCENVGSEIFNMAAWLPCADVLGRWTNVIFDACVHDDRDPNLMKFLKRDHAFTKDLVMFKIFSIILSTLGFIHS